MNIYFAGSIRGGQQDALLYQELIQHLKQSGTVLTEHVGDPQKLMQQTYTESEIWEQDMAWLSQSKFLIAECTVTSLGVGYEIGIAEKLGIPILVLFRGEECNLSAMITGNSHIKVLYYQNIEEAKDGITKFLRK